MIIGPALGAAGGMAGGPTLSSPTPGFSPELSYILLAGLEVRFRELRQEAGVLAQHVAIRVVTLLGGAFVIRALLGLPLRPATLVSLALLTPSTGFILDALAGWGLSDRERFGVKSKAIASELVALVVLFVTLQSETLERFAAATLILAGLVAVLPLAFRLFAERIVPFAPQSEFAFLLMVAVLAAFLTRRLGVYYLVGAFVVGVTARRFRERLPAIASEQMLHAVEVFASFFVPFYFFAAGLHLRQEDFGLGVLLLGVAFLGLALPLRLALLAIHRRLVLKEPVTHSARIALPMMPTLVFTLVIAGILRDEFGVSLMVFGGLMVYTLVNTLLPGLALRAPVPDFAAPRAPALDTPIPEEDA
jgi:Kef-type K+ transport system membrane component KefB